MAVEGVYKVIKYLMFGFNVVFMLLGCLILAMGIWIRVDSNIRDAAQTLGDKEGIFTIAYVLIAVGGIATFVGFLGCFGAIRESQWMLAAFFALVLLMLIVLITCGVILLTFRHHLRPTIEENLKEHIQNYQRNQTSRDLLDNIQRNLRCCGSDGISDYRIGTYPASCKEEYKEVGCSDVLHATIDKSLVILAGIGMGIGLIMFAGLILSMLLCCKIRSGGGQGDYGGGK